jgi:hypothetical protein
MFSDFSDRSKLVQVTDRFRLQTEQQQPIQCQDKQTRRSLNWPKFRQTRSANNDITSLSVNVRQNMPMPFRAKVMQVVRDTLDPLGSSKNEFDATQSHQAECAFRLASSGDERVITQSRSSVNRPRQLGSNRSNGSPGVPHKETEVPRLESRYDHGRYYRPSGNDRNRSNDSHH